MKNVSIEARASEFIVLFYPKWKLSQKQKQQRRHLAWLQSILSRPNCVGQTSAKSFSSVMFTIYNNFEIETILC